MLIGHTYDGNDVESHSEEEPWLKHQQFGLGANRKDLDQSVLQVLAKMVITHVDVLGTWAKHWEPGKFQHT
jgi:hypothetical protein